MLRVPALGQAPSASSLQPPSLKGIWAVAALSALIYYFLRSPEGKQTPVKKRLDPLQKYEQIRARYV